MAAMTKRELINFLERSSYEDDTPICMSSMINCEDFVEIIEVEEAHIHQIPGDEDGPHIPLGMSPRDFPQKDIFLLQTEFACLQCMEDEEDEEGDDDSDEENRGEDDNSGSPLNPMLLFS